MEYSRSAYLPANRRQALARGAALFAAISGFTPLTEALARALGLRRRAEELTHQLNAIYDALIAQVDHFGGSVTSFSGDAITCWFDDRGIGDGKSEVEGSAPAPATLRAAACVLIMHRAMAQFGGVALPSGGIVTLALKAAIASGP